MGVRRGHLPLALDGDAGIDAVGITARITLPTLLGPVEGVIVSVPDLPDRLVTDQQRALAHELRAVQLAEQAGVRAIGLGSALGVVAGRGAPLAAHTNLPVTTGDASTAWACARITARLATEHPGPIGVIGAKGTVGDAVVQWLVDAGHEVLVDVQGRAARRAETVGARAVDRETLLERCRLVVGASTTGPVLSPSELSPGTRLVDLALPPTLEPGPLPSGCRVFAGETLVVPGRIRAGFWGRVWLTMAAYGRGCVFACLAEPIALALEPGVIDSRARRLPLDQVKAAGQALEHLGFHPVVRRR